MDNLNITKIVEILGIQSHSKDESRMVSYIVDYILNLIKSRNDIFMEYDEEGNIYVTKGIAEYYPTVVSHIDTVHEIKDGDLNILSRNDVELIAYDAKGEQTGIGGDDKVGVYVCLDMLDKIDAIKIAFFSREEIGCIGSSKCRLDFFKDSSFIIQCDRKGSKDFIQYGSGVQLFSKEFSQEILPYLEKWNYNITTGGQTDVVELKEKGLNISSFNMSCGYYDPHTSNEYVNLSDVNNCVGLVQDLIKNLSNRSWIHEKNKIEKPKSCYSYSVEDFNNHYSGIAVTKKTKPKNNKNNTNICDSTTVTYEDNCKIIKKYKSGVLISETVEPLNRNRIDRNKKKVQTIMNF